MKAAESYVIVDAAILEVGPVVLPIPRDDVVFRRYYSVIEELC